MLATGWYTLIQFVSLLSGVAAFHVQVRSSRRRHICGRRSGFALEAEDSQKGDEASRPSNIRRWGHRTLLKNKCHRPHHFSQRCLPASLKTPFVNGDSSGKYLDHLQA